MKEFIELLKTQNKWESLAPEVRKTTLEQINATIKKDNRWERRHGEPSTLLDLVRARCYHDIYYDMLAQIMECDFGVLRVFNISSPMFCATFSLSFCLKKVSKHNSSS